MDLRIVDGLVYVDQRFVYLQKIQKRKRKFESHLMLTAESWIRCAIFIVSLLMTAVCEGKTTKPNSFSAQAAAYEGEKQISFSTQAFFTEKPRGNALV